MAYYIATNKENENNLQKALSFNNFRNILAEEHLPKKTKYPPFVDQVHGLSLALFSKSSKLKVFWWLVFFACTGCGIFTTALVIIEYIQVPTATSITIKLVPSFELPAATICPQTPDALNYEPLFKDIQRRLPAITNETALDLVRFWLGGSGLKNIWTLEALNQTYLSQLNQMYKVWSEGYNTQSFFHRIQADYGYKCEQLFLRCELGGNSMDCCKEMFQPVWVVEQGLCYQTRRGLNQTKTHNDGLLYIQMKGPPSITTSARGNMQSSLYIYINEKLGQIITFPRFRIFPGNENFLHLRARLIELLGNSEDCTTKITGEDASCFVQNWLESHVLDTLNCTVPYIRNVPGIATDTKICDPATIANNYSSVISTNNIRTNKTCKPGCKKWDYTMWLDARNTYDVNSIFYFTFGYDNLQYEHVREISTISISGLISQVGGQLGLYLGISIVTLLQIVVYCVNRTIRFLYRLLRPLKIGPEVGRDKGQRVDNGGVLRGSDNNV